MVIIFLLLLLIIIQQQAIALGALPQNIPNTLKNIAALVDDIWYFAEDKSTDVSTKTASNRHQSLTLTLTHSFTQLLSYTMICFVLLSSPSFFSLTHTHALIYIYTLSLSLSSFVALLSLCWNYIRVIIVTTHSAYGNININSICLCVCMCFWEKR